MPGSVVKGITLKHAYFVRLSGWLENRSNATRLYAILGVANLAVLAGLAFYFIAASSARSPFVPVANQRSSSAPEAAYSKTPSAVSYSATPSPARISFAGTEANAEDSGLQPPPLPGTNINYVNVPYPPLTIAPAVAPNTSVKISRVEGEQPAPSPAPSESSEQQSIPIILPTINPANLPKVPGLLPPLVPQQAPPKETIPPVPAQILNPHLVSVGQTTRIPNLKISINPNPWANMAHAYDPIALPSISFETFERFLRDNNSPALPEAASMYDTCVLEGCDPALALAFFEHESTLGKNGAANITHSIGNIRCSAGYSCINTEGNGSFRYYPNWTAGVRDWVLLLKNTYRGEWGLSTLEQIIPRYAPNADNNNEAWYIYRVKLRVYNLRFNIR